eukprot:1160178-Pelagomonas_calceolata.AAC.2
MGTYYHDAFRFPLKSAMTIGGNGRKEKGYLAVFANMGSLAEAKKVPITKPVPAGGQEQNK